ncbi:sulfite exporter TauE/SafE family protein [Salinarimonas sp.]|uniref:sulfite exporter TauE/SafE family protein n=1 Tax=Salinarimonas sp. TaxID=2766526 RepID=UPI0032D8F131
MLIYLPVAEMPVSLFMILGLGAAVGFISGLFGIGGGFLMTPLLIFLGIPPAVAVATQTAQIVASSTTSGLAALRRRALDFKLGVVLVMGGLVGTALGVWTFAAARRAGQLDLLIVVSYVTLFTVVGSLMLRESVREFMQSRKGKPRVRRRAGEHPAYLGLPLRMRFHRSKLYASVIPLWGLALFIGFAGAMLGIGGGFILVPALLYLFRVPTAVVVGTSQFQILCTTIAALILHAVANEAVDLVLALMLIVGGVFGAQFGARASANLRADVFRFLLALLILGVGLRFAVELVLPPEELFSLSITQIAGEDVSP